jgi:steroid delta-isomerase-like uncharacterized protein
MAHDNSAIVRRWFEQVWNERREATIDELLTAESVCHADDGPMRGPEEFKARQYLPFLSAFPDIRVDLEAVLARGDEVVARWSARGTHSGEGLGFRATQQSVEFRGMTWLRLRDGKFVEGWQHSNIPEVVRSLSST